MSANFSFATAKVVNYFGLSKKNCILVRFFVWRIGNYFRNLVNLFRNRVNLFRILVNFFRKPILRKVLFWRQGVESEFSRSSLGVLRKGIREVKESAILTNSTF